MDCEFRNGNRCTIADGLSPAARECGDDHCRACLASPRPQAINSVTTDLAASGLLAANRNADAVALLRKHKAERGEVDDSKNREQRLAHLKASRGVGGWTHWTISWLGFEISSTCQCLTRAEQMDAWGVLGCIRHCSTILTWLRDEARGRRKHAAGWRWLLLCCAWRPCMLGLLAVAIGLAVLFRPRKCCVGGTCSQGPRQAIEDLSVSIAPKPLTPWSSSPSPPPPTRVEKLILTCELCPGDLLTLTAALESLHATYPGQYVTDVRTKHPAIWTGNPWVTKLADDDPDARRIEMHYPSVHRCNEELRPFLAGYTEYLGEQLGRPLRLRTTMPHLYVAPEESPTCPTGQTGPTGQTCPTSPPLWLLVAGTKNDYTCKQWPVEFYQEVVDRTAGRIHWVQIGLTRHNHPPLTGVESLLDTGPPMRDLILLMRRAAGALGPVTFLQHLAAAWDKPYVCLVGGREPSHWVQYPRQQTLHTVGGLDCCRDKACWKARVVPLHDGQKYDQNLCVLPRTEFTRPVAECMARITPDDVLAAIERAGG